MARAKGIEFSARVKASEYALADGKCRECRVLCTASTGQEYHHKKSAWEGGDGSLGNCMLLCTNCHAPHTADAIRTTARCDRKARKSIGAKPKSSRPIPGSKNSPFIKRMDGTVERRNQ